MKADIYIYIWSACMRVELMKQVNVALDKLVEFTEE